uniref:Uncharacterized protein n=1 Tax=Clastoptera arizonana TaxID=38151 RepID=A0A1B6D223_9HEMI
MDDLEDTMKINIKTEEIHIIDIHDYSQLMQDNLVNIKQERYETNYEHPHFDQSNVKKEILNGTIDMACKEYPIEEKPSFRVEEEDQGDFLESVKQEVCSNGASDDVTIDSTSSRGLETMWT